MNLRRFAAIALLSVCALGFVACSKPASKEVASMGSIEVTARLEEIKDKFPPNDLYDYVFIMKYRVLRVHRGNVTGDTILVGHYNPLKPRRQAQDQFSGTVGGGVVSFRAGDVHRMALQAPLDKHYMGGIIDKYFGEPGVRHWAIWTDRGQ